MYTSYKIDDSCKLQTERIRFYFITKTLIKGEVNQIVLKKKLDFGEEKRLLVVKLNTAYGYLTYEVKDETDSRNSEPNAKGKGNTN